MLTPEMKAKKIATAEKRLAKLEGQRASAAAQVTVFDREIRLAKLDLEHRKATPTAADVDEAEAEEATEQGDEPPLPEGTSNVDEWIDPYASKQAQNGGQDDLPTQPVIA